jgi:predicted Holliday junction resolvase-like endonuclease
MIYFTIIVLLVIGALIYILQDAKAEIKTLQTKLEEKDAAHVIEKAKVHQNSKFKSSAVNWGFTVENFVPFIDTFPVPSEDVNFLGKPIDFIGFTKTDSKTNCEVHFIEVKSGQSALSQKQRNIKAAIEQGRVRWHEVRVAANTAK